MSERKYKHRGDVDSGSSSGEDRPPRASGERPRPPATPADRAERGDRPRGRGLGAPTEAVFRCTRCGALATVAAAMAFEARCTGCGGDLHSCSNCTSFDPGAHFQCRREIPERISPKDRANRCELFEPRTRQEFGQEKPKEPGPGNARSAFDALFKI